MLNEIAKQLNKIGLTEKEAAVYLSLLEEGAATADQLSKRTTLNRSTVYVQIENLTEKGIVSSFKKGKKTFFAAESPNNLDRLLDQQVKEVELHKAQLASFMPDLMKIYTSLGARPSVRMFEGKEGLVSMREEIIALGHKDLCIAFSFDGMSRIFTEEELMDFSNRRAQKGIVSKVLYTKTGPDIPVVPPQQIKRISTEDFPFTADIYVYGDNVSFAITQEQIAGVTVVSASLAKSVRSLFLLGWGNA